MKESIKCGIIGCENMALVLINSNLMLCGEHANKLYKKQKELENERIKSLLEVN